MERNREFADLFRRTLNETGSQRETLRRLADHFDLGYQHVRLLATQLKLRKKTVVGPAKIREEAQSAVYFILAEEPRPLVKIGYSEHIFTRFDSIQASCPVRLILYGFMVHVSARQIEQALHEQLARFHSHAEWFNRTDEVWSIINAYVKVPINRQSSLAPPLNTERSRGKVRSHP
jgi:hypothetical protein